METGSLSHVAMISHTATDNNVDIIPSSIWLDDKKPVRMVYFRMFSVTRPPRLMEPRSSAMEAIKNAWFRERILAPMEVANAFETRKGQSKRKSLSNKTGWLTIVGTEPKS